MAYRDTLPQGYGCAGWVVVLGQSWYVLSYWGVLGYSATGGMGVLGGW